ncbi:tyrosine-protein phosphatase [Antrihabitans sp. YC2-6]|uniref:tyrosine-protein phosphatase n=1 Tax=Antrihabitans sp. YC2-6 TaxID=2799498 RepID=UPI0018F5F824|nr:tyrosine-protein phosphatase [Antrihabitans sp. YC2-6]MBJ8343576.1 tyrosine-protein phosphatase [Antrihabitans sp. YC2-6]
MPTDQYHLSGAWNFREVSGLRSADGKTLRPGIVFRSSQLSGLDADGQRTLVELGITDVFDLRGTKEAEVAGADALPEGVRLHAEPVHELRRDERAPHEESGSIPTEVAQAELEKAYAEFPTLQGAHTALVNLIQTVADGTGAVLIHCAAGKDRAGWLTAALLRAAGIEDDDVLSDYLRSNDGVEPLRAMLSAKYGAALQLSNKILGVDESYYRTAWRVVDETYGGFDNYLDKLGIDSDTLDRLRTRLLD